jgi:uncharacterized protein
MPTITPDTIIAQTKKWITDVVVGCNFCPFAAREIKRGGVHYEVLEKATLKNTLETCSKLWTQLDHDETVETSLLVLPNDFMTFTTYLDLVNKAEMLLSSEGYEGVYQIASFHPQYLFAGSHTTDPSNYTNRSPYPMLHFLRESGVTKAVDNHPNIDEVPLQNMAYTKAKGLSYMQQLFANCMDV